MKKIIIIVLINIIGAFTVFAQNDTVKIDIDLPDFGNTTKEDDTSKPIVKTANQYNFLKNAIYLISIKGKTDVGYSIDGNLWTKASYSKNIDNLGEDDKVKFKNLNDTESFSNKVRSFKNSKYKLSYIEDVKIEKSLSDIHTEEPEAVTLVLFFVNKNENPFEVEEVQMETISQKLKWENGKGTLKNKIFTKDRKILGGVFIKKVAVEDGKSLGINNGTKTKKRIKKKDEEKNSVFPLGVFQYKSCGILINENESFFAYGIPDNTYGFESENGEKVEKKSKKKKRSSRSSRRSRGRRR